MKEELKESSRFKSRVKKFLKLAKDKKKQKRYFGWLWRQSKPSLSSICFITIINVALSLSAVISTIITKRIIDAASGNNPHLDFFMIAAMVAISLGTIIIGSVSNILSTFVNEKFVFRIRNAMFGKVLRGDWKQMQQFHSGDVMTRVTSDIDSIASGMYSFIPSVVYIVVRFVSSFIVLFNYDHALAVAAIFLGPFGMLGGFFFSGKLKDYQKQLKENESEFRSFMQESVVNLTIVKTFEQEKKFEDRLLEVRNKRLKIMWKRNILSTLVNCSVNIIYAVGYAAAFIWGIYRLSKGDITYGMMSVFLSLVTQISSPISQLGRLVPQAINILTSTGRVLDIDVIKPECSGDIKEISEESNIGIKFTNVDFAYKKENVLENITLDIAPGNIVGVLGESGAGKTTLARLILSLVSPNSGKVEFYDGVSGKTETVSASTRRFISYVPQGNTLLSGTIRQNLQVGSDSASEEEMWSALECADIADFIRNLPDGLDTQLTEKAGTISEGQAQRIAIARAILRNTPIVILDEATSALDIKTESKIVSNLKNNFKGFTCLIITHRPSLLDLCNKTYRIQANKLSEEI